MCEEILCRCDLDVILRLRTFYPSRPYFWDFPRHVILAFGSHGEIENL